MSRSSFSSYYCQWADFSIKPFAELILSNVKIVLRLQPVPRKNLIQSDLLKKTGTPVLFTVIGRIGSSRTMEHIIRWVSSFSNTFSQPFYRSSTPHDYPIKKKIWKS